MSFLKKNSIKEFDSQSRASLFLKMKVLFPLVYRIICLLYHILNSHMHLVTFPEYLFYIIDLSAITHHTIIVLIAIPLLYFNNLQDLYLNTLQEVSSF